MSIETRRVASQIRRSQEGVAWHGPSVLEALYGVDHIKAATHPLPAAHSIWELVKHVTAWQRIAALALAGGQYESMTGDADWPPIADTSADAWRADLAAMAEVNARLVAAVRAFPPERLDEIVAATEFNFYFLLHGIAQHNVYHAGQIALLNQAR